MPEVTGQFNNLWTRKIDETFFEGWDQEPEQWPKFMRNEVSNQHNETYQSFAGTTAWTQKNEMSNADEQTFNLADLIVTEHTPYGAEVIMSREYIADQRYNEIMDLARDIGDGGRTRVEENCISVLDDAFTVNQYDGVPLFSASHPYRKTGLAGVQSNLATGALSDTTVKAGINLFNTINDESGKRKVFNPSKLITHKDNQFTVATIFQSSQRSGTANNDKNVLPDMEFCYSNYLASTTAWFLQSKQHKLIHFYRVKPEFVKRKYMNPNGSQSWDAYLRDSTVVRNWRGMVGSTGV
jgi:hypothetical protein